MIGIVVEQNQLFRPAFHDDVNRLSPVTVPPATFVSFIFFRQILRIVDQHIGARRQFAHTFIKLGISRLVVGRVNHHPLFAFQPETHAALRMV